MYARQLSGFLKKSAASSKVFGSLSITKLNANSWSCQVYSCHILCLALKEIAEVASSGPEGRSAPQQRNKSLLTSRLHYQRSCDTFGAAGVEHSFSQYHRRLSEIQLALGTIAGVGLFGNFETEAHNVSAHAVERTSRFLQPAFAHCDPN
jgi:hypothetical protein